MVKKRNTRQKEIMENELAKIDSFFTADEFHEKILAKDKNMGIATIYRFLSELKENNKIYSYICDRKTVFTTQDNSHCHFICEKTGKIIHFKIDSIDFLKNKIPGSIKSFQLEIRGECKDDCNKCCKD
ncbi:MAG: Fur family transcriptional regulator [Candidatus Woesearchaeota archaeon]